MFFTGGSTFLALSFIGSNIKEKNAETEVLINKADSLYNNKMVNKCWEVLRK